MSTVAILQYDDFVVHLVNDPTKLQEIWQFAEKYAGKEPEIPDAPLSLPRKKQIRSSRTKLSLGKDDHNIFVD
uniref:Uncharacterized protein n=1 Tax=Marseillevirus sp. TaxID=2809551 RepID=A0AA96EPQ0_9VIRU|nr:hypothetical protein MarDSR_012 [Marseillevirus sp.]